MATILKQPGSIAISGNISDILLSSSTPIDFSITNSDNTETYLSENYDPDSLNQITIRLRDILPTLLKVNVPTSDVFEQVNASKTFRFVVNETVIETRVVKAGVDADIDAATFLKTNWLTWQNQQKRVKYIDAEWLSYFAVEAVSVKVKAYFKEGDPQIITLASLAANKQYSLNMNFAYLSGKFTEQPVYFDVWTENGSATRLSFIQRYVLHKDYNEFEDVFVFENTLGGLDSIRFTGEKEESNVFETESALVDEVTTDYDIDFERIFEINTGYFADEHTRQWTNDFFNSLQRYVVTADGLKSISVSKPKAKSVKGELSSYDFKFALSKQTPYLNLPRTDQLPDVVEIVDPESTLFFLAPRLNEFQNATICDELTFPVQIPFVKEWKQLSFGAVKAALIEQVANTIVVPSGLDESQLQSYLTTNKYVTQDWIAEQNFETNLEGYATEQWVTQKNYLTQHQDISAYAKTNDVWTKTTIANLDKITIDANGNLLVPGDVISFADMGGDYGSIFDNLPLASISSKGIAQFNSTHFTVENGLVSVRDSVVGLDENALATYLTNNSYATQDWVSQQDYLTQHQDLTGYATEQWVTQKNYLTQHQDISAYAKTNDVWTKAVIPNLDKITIDANGNLLVPGDVISFADMGGDYGSIFDNLPLASISSKGIAQFNSTHFTVENGLVSSIVSGGVVTETDPTVPTHVKNILSAQITQWDAAYAWGNHASQGYIVEDLSMAWNDAIISNKIGFNSHISQGAMPEGYAEFGFVATMANNPNYGGAFTMRNKNAYFKTRENGVLSDWFTMYHSGNKPTYTDVGAASSSHTHSYLPLTGGTLTGDITTKKIKVNGIIHATSSASLQVNGFMRTGNIYLHSGGDTPDLLRASDILGNNSGTLQWKSHNIYHEGIANRSDVDWSARKLTVTNKVIVGDYSSTGDKLIQFQRGSATDGVNDWRIINTGGSFKIQCRNNISDNTWLNGMTFSAVSAQFNPTFYYNNVARFEITSIGTKTVGASAATRGFRSTYIDGSYRMKVHYTNTNHKGLWGLSLMGDNIDNYPNAAQFVLDVNSKKIFSDSSITIENGNYAGDGGWDDVGLKLRNTSTTTGEAAVSYSNSGSAGTGSNYWIHGLNQSNILKFAYGTSFTDGNMRMQIDINGNFTAKGDVTAYSDMRVKRYVKPLTNVLSNLDRLSAFYYTRTDIEDKTSLHIGVSAQSLRGIYPEFVKVLNDKRRTLTVDYSKFGASIAIQGLKETKVWMDSRDRRILKLEKEVEKLKQQLNVA